MSDIYTGAFGRRATLPQRVHTEGVSSDSDSDSDTTHKTRGQRENPRKKGGLRYVEENEDERKTKRKG